MVFEPGVTSPELSDHRHGRLFVLAGQALRIAPDAEILDDDLFLGVLDGEPCFARGVERDADATPLRQLFGVISDDEFAVAGRALGILAWDRDHRHCGRCGSQTVRSATERARTCSACGFVAYPRISPAIITLVERDGRALLARNARTQMPFYSTLAGFVELGETLEECVAREVHEEAGIAIRDVAYFGSQPWPFTGSLMVGFTANWASGELAPDPSEIFDAQWFAPDALPQVPPKLSIARALIDDFVRRATMM
ncbi:MAG TPA: NAD(+) diphosphatase [Kofleriaceae bacterium]|jgi:NAD+ diphosphatase|nr:NAD(+) diphosphatase [Kofleriaceae bacterium]